MSLYHIAYISRASAEFNQNNLKDILKTAKTFNQSQEITGMLIYNGGVFLQVLEGEQDKVDSLYTKIAQDPRHIKCKRIYYEPSSVRIFGHWSMNGINLECDKPKNLEVLKEIIDAAASGRSIGQTSPVLKLLKEFKAVK